MLKKTGKAAMVALAGLLMLAPGKALSQDLNRHDNGFHLGWFNNGKADTDRDYIRFQRGDMDRDDLIRPIKDRDDLTFRRGDMDRDDLRFRSDMDRDDTLKTQGVMNSGFSINDQISPPLNAQFNGEMSNQFNPELTNNSMLNNGWMSPSVQTSNSGWFGNIFGTPTWSNTSFNTTGAVKAGVIAPVHEPMTGSIQGPFDVDVSGSSKIF